MPYKDPEKQREHNRLRQARFMKHNREAYTKIQKRYWAKAKVNKKCVVADCTNPCPQKHNSCYEHSLKVLTGNDQLYSRVRKLMKHNLGVRCTDGGRDIYFVMLVLAKAKDELNAI